MISQKKYELIPTDTVTTLDGRKLFRIRALVAIAALGISVGDTGGYVESEANLSQVSGNAWVSGNALVYGNAQVYGNALVYGDARVCGNAQVYGNALVYGDARVCGNAQVYGNALVYGDARVCGNESLGWMSKVGSENGTLTWFVTKDRGVSVNRGCFYGTLDQFDAAVTKTHGDSDVGQQYRLLIQFIRLRAKPALDAMPAADVVEAA